MERTRTLCKLRWKNNFFMVPLHQRADMQVAQGVIPEPAWLEPLSQYPPDEAMVYIRDKSKEVVLPTNTLFHRLLTKRMPFFQFEYYEELGTFRSLGQRVVQRQWTLMKAGLSEDHAFQACEREFATEIDRLLTQVKRNQQEMQEVPVSAVMEAKDSRVRKHLELRAALRRGGAEPKPRSPMAVLEDRLHEVNWQRPERFPKLHLNDVVEMGQQRKKQLAELAYEQNYKKIFRDPLKLSPKSTSPIVKELAAWFNRMRFDPPPREARERVHAFGKELAVPANWISAAKAEFGARLADYLAFFELEKKWRTEGAPPSEGQEEVVSEMPLVRAQERIYTREMADQQNTLAETFRAVYHKNAPDFSKPPHEQLRIPGLHDLIPDMDRDKWLRGDDNKFKTDMDRYAFTFDQILKKNDETKTFTNPEGLFQEVIVRQKKNLLKREQERVAAAQAALSASRGEEEAAESTGEELVAPPGWYDEHADEEASKGGPQPYDL